MSVGQANRALEAKLDGMKAAMEAGNAGMKATIEASNAAMKATMDAAKSSVDQMRVWLIIVTSIIAICALAGSVLGVVAQFMK